MRNIPLSFCTGEAVRQGPKVALGKNRQTGKSLTVPNGGFVNRLQIASERHSRENALFQYLSGRESPEPLPVDALRTGINPPTRTHECMISSNKELPSLPNRHSGSANRFLFLRFFFFFQSLYASFKHPKILHFSAIVSAQAKVCKGNSNFTLRRKRS